MILHRKEQSILHKFPDLDIKPKRGDSIDINFSGKNLEKKNLFGNYQLSGIT